jgi:peroxiredoxin Q/BCP
LVKQFGVWKEKSMFGKTYMGISRESFLIDPKGKVVKHYEKVKPAEHALQVLQDVKALKDE